MANIHSTITYNANLSAAQAQIKALTTQIGTLTAAFNTLDKSALTAQRSLAATFAAGVGQTGGFTTSTVKATSAVETFGKQLAANRLTMRSYFREAINGYTRQNSLMRQLAAQQVRYQQSIAVPVGGGQAMMMTPQSINAASNAAALASQRFAVFNKLMDGGATAMLNWGKNTQWAGRQLMVGFTVPLMLFTAVASKQFRELDRELVRFQKVYGSDLGNAISDSTDRMREQVKQLAFDISRTYGIAAKDTAALAADIAATGREGEALISSVQQTTRLAVLGEVDRQEAMKATLSLQSAFRMNTNELAESINFLNAVENQTSATLEDLATAIPKVGPVVRSLGGDVKDLATLLVAMREGGIPAAEAANALKSGLSALINPTKQASDVAKQFGIDLVGIVEANKGQLMPTIYAMQEALSGLDSFGRSRVIEQIFGRYQFARITALFDNIGRVGSQTQSVVELASKSSAELAAVANQELRVLTESTAMRFQRTLEDLKNAIMPIGQTLTETLIPIFEFLGSGLKTVTSFFQALPEPVKNFAKYGVAIAALAGPIIMMVGLFGNLIANGIKFGMMMTRLGARIAGIRIEKFELLNQEVMAAKLGIDGLTKSFDTQENSLRRLTGVLSAYESSLRRLTTANPALFIPGALPAARSAMPIRRQAGSIGPEFVPGTGQGDKIPAMLEPGEFIVNRSATEKYAPVLMAMNRGNLPGFQEGGPTRLAHLTGSTRMPIQSILSQDVASPAARRVLQQMLADGINEVKLFNNLVIALRKSTNDSLNTEVEGRGVRKSILAAELQDRQRWSLMMKATGVSFEQLQPVINGITMSMNNLEGELINDPQLYRVVEQELIRLSNAGDQAAQRLLALSRQFGTFEYMRSDSNRPGRAALGVAASGVGTYKGSRLAAGSWSREFLLDMQNALDAEMSRTIQSSSPSRKSTEIGDKAGRNIGLGVLNGLQSGLTAATSGRRVSPIGPGMEATSPSARLTNAMQREINARTILEKALIKETQQTGLIADTKARMKTIQEKSNVSLANWTKSLEDGAWVHKNGTVAGKKRVVALEALAAEEMILKSQQEKLAAIVVLRQRAEENARISADNKAAADRTLTDANVRRAASSFGIGPGGSMGYFMTGTSPYATGTGKLSASAFDRKMADIAKMAGPTSSLSNRPAASTGPSVALGAARDQAQGGMRGIGAMNAVFALSMVTSSISMMGGASEEAAGKLSLFTTALMAASSLLMLRGMGGGMTSNFLGMGSLANQAGAANLRRSGMAGATAAQAGQLRALGYGKELGKLSGALSVLSGPVGIAAAAAVTGVAGAYLLVQNAADEARRRSVAAFEDPIKSAEYFGETVADVNQQMKDLNASMTEEQVEGIDQALRDAVKTDYADLIEKIRYGSATAGARELSLAFNKMIASGMSEENAVAAVKAIAIESGQAGGAAFAQAYTDGLLKAKTPQDVANNLAAQFDPELMTRNAEEIQKNIENFDLGPMADMAGNTAELLDNTFGDILLGVSSFASNINLSMQGLRFVKNFLPEGARDNAFVTAFDQLFNKDEAAATIDVAANYSRGMEQLMANLAENMDVSSTQIIGVVETLFSTFKEAPTESMAAFDKIAETALAFDNVEFDPVPIQDFLNTLDPLAAITLSPLIQDNEELALQIMKAVAAGMSLQEILEAIKDESLEIEINIKVRTQELEVALNELKTSYSDAVSGALGDDVEALDDRISNLTNRIEDLNKQKEKSLERMQKDFDAEQKMREDSVDGLQDELDQKRELFDEEMEALDERQQKVEEASDVYIKSLEKNQKADSFYAQQRKTALGALQKLASGDVFGFLQERQQMSADAQEFSYDQMISDIEERRDIEIDAIDEIREKRQKEQDEYEKNMEDKIDGIRDLMEMEQEAHEQAMQDEEKRFNTKIRNTKEELREKRTQREELQDIIDDATNGEITSAQELARRLPPEQAKQYIQKQKEIIKNIFLLEYAKELEEGGTEESAKSRAARVAMPLYSMLTGAKDQGALSADQLMSQLSITGTDMTGQYYGTTTGGNTGGRTTTGPTNSSNGPTTWPNWTPGASPYRWWNGQQYKWDNVRKQWVLAKANGGKVTGPGGPKSDVIPAMLSNGEYVIQASSVNKYGKDMMDHINAGKFAGGGPISTSRAAADANATFRGNLPSPIRRAEGGEIGDIPNRGLRGILSLFGGAEGNNKNRPGADQGGGATGTPLFNEKVLSSLGVSLSTAQSVLGFLNSGGWPKDLHRLAWTIAMRESGGNPKLYHDHINNPGMYSPGNGDYGLFQINKRAYGNQPWFDVQKLLDGGYNSRIAYEYISRRGTTFMPWALLKNYNGTSAGFDWSSYGGRPSWGATSERNTNALWPAFLGYRGGTVPASSPGNGTDGELAVAFARQQLGEPYVVNGDGPNQWDCSGLTAAAYNVGVPNGYKKYSLVSYSTDQANRLRIVSRRASGNPGDGSTPNIPDNFGVGDILYFTNTGLGASGKHVSLYAGNGQIIEAGSPVQINPLNNLWNRKYFTLGGPPIPKFASGGFIAGPGGPRSDMIPAMLSNGEYVVKASSVAKYGKGFMDQINAGQFGAGGMAMAKPMSMAPRGYADGGFVGSVPMATPTFGMPQMASVSPADISANVSNSFGGDSNSATVNSSKVNVIINASGGKSAKAIANRVISIINEANGRRNHSRSI